MCAAYTFLVLETSCNSAFGDGEAQRCLCWVSCSNPAGFDNCIQISRTDALDKCLSHDENGPKAMQLLHCAINRTSKSSRCSITIER